MEGLAPFVPGGIASLDTAAAGGWRFNSALNIDFNIFKSFDNKKLNI